MNNAVPQASLETLPLENDDLKNRRYAGAYPQPVDDPGGLHPRSNDDLAHALRQPLSTIESLAYYLELTTEDDQICRHLRQIRLMVDRANRILEQAGS
jgi:hypothetical protein